MWEPIDKEYYICQTYNRLGKSCNLMICSTHTDSFETCFVK